MPSLSLPPFPEPRPAGWREALPWLAGAGAVALILGLLSFIMVSEFARTDQLRRTIDQSHDRRDHIAALFSNLQDVEVGQRGYLLTGNDRFLAPYRDARRQLGGKLNLLVDGSDASNEQRASSAAFAAAVRDKLRFVDHTVYLQSIGEGDEARRQVAAGDGRRQMDRIRRIVAEAEQAEERQIATRTSAWREARRRAQQLGIGLELLLVILLIGASLTVARTLAARRRAMDKLGDLNARYQAILNAARDGIIVINPSGSIESLNPAAARMYGYQPEELVRRDVGLLLNLTPEQGLVESFLRRMRRRGGDEGFAQEFCSRRRDGSTFETDVAVSPVQLAEGTRYMAVIRDVTERKQVDQMKSDFVATVSHELRTPLTSIAGALGLLAGRAAGELPAKATRLIEIARSNAERLVRLINDMLDIEKIESGKVAMRIERVPLRPLIEEAVEANRAFAARHDVELMLGLCPEGATVMADRDRLAQVLTNLLSNAAKFSADGTTVEVSVASHGRCHRITVADRGPGIPDAFRERIFQKFAQADSSGTRAQGGTGLGLSIVREILVRLGGAIGFEDREGGGTCFHADLPAAAMAECQNCMEPATASPDCLRILHVDDDPDVVSLVTRMLAHAATVESAASIEEAKYCLAERGFDLVIADLDLPDGSGRSLIGTAPVPVVVFSAQEEEAPIAGAAATLVKSRASLDQLASVALELAREHRFRPSKAA
jgi:PAS domain S-box-containing protein